MPKRVSNTPKNLKEGPKSCAQRAQHGRALKPHLRFNENFASLSCVAATISVVLPLQQALCCLCRSTNHSSTICFCPELFISHPRAKNACVLPRPRQGDLKLCPPKAILVFRQGRRWTCTSYNGPQPPPPLPVCNSRRTGDVVGATVGVADPCCVPHRQASAGENTTHPKTRQDRIHFFSPPCYPVAPRVETLFYSLPLRYSRCRRAPSAARAAPAAATLA